MLTVNLSLCLPRRHIGSAGKAPRILNTNVIDRGNYQVSALVVFCWANAVTDIGLVTAGPKLSGSRRL